jgi:hypothetical protein
MSWAEPVFKTIQRSWQFSTPRFYAARMELIIKGSAGCQPFYNELDLTAACGPISYGPT